ncbi:hypothetical protein N7462_002572 [Penicillium macrosclerotiorum]|uniref:uncharacterized protein n=1 Tax=Penicillium macrosclerotiorum TaxID=303699 RepID=UPI0025477FFD|nr:uncharacterized protein N7462_002572 [Penicillium macrosclerotiorum]KAJ5693149.1 hypothetical protein N7462_002572 [Penicillium macrosclerotiorum]
MMFRYPNPPRQNFTLTFINNKKSVRRLSAENAAKHRQAIFTENERLQMSDSVSNSVPWRDTQQALLDLKRVESSPNSTEPFSIFHGPFGVSRFSKSSELGEQPLEPEVPSLSALDWIDDLTHVTREEGLDDLDDGLFSSLLSDSENNLNDHPGFWDLVDPGFQGMETSPFMRNQISPSLSLFTTDIEAWTILSHYKDRIVPLVCPFGHGQEAPWLNLVMPCAVATLGELTINSSTNNARLALLNALLSTSAFHLGQSSAVCIQHWITSGNLYLTRAQYHFAKCMEENCTSATKLSKYKDILMAILSLSAVYMIKGDPEKHLSCLVQAEKIISIKGFKQFIVSPKRRALHHCYAYMRILAETTCLADGLSTGFGDTTIFSEDADNLEFRIHPDIAFSDNIMAMEKDPNIAQRDLHLAIPGRWSLTLFPKMYGVAESFLMLLSQVIRLANERDLSLLENEAGGMLNLKDFWLRAKALEKAIHVLLSSFTMGIVRDDDASQIEVNNPRAQTFEKLMP